MSSFSGLLAGFVFSAVVIVIGQRREEADALASARALKLMLPGFVGLAMASYLRAVIAGEGVCFRASTEEVFSGGVLCVEAVLVLVGITWLIPAYGRTEHDELKIFRWTIQVVAQFCSLQGFLSADNFEKSLGVQNVWMTAAIWTFAALSATGILYYWMHPLGSFSDDARVSITAKASLLTVAAFTILGGATVSTPESIWSGGVDAWPVFLIGQAIPTISAAVILFSLSALPRADPEPDTSSAGIV
ncbi:hypothetical protein [Streptomyces asoensis]|uniref:hypothetical protein n=1 Tax=Streptomyces asoensis TaxID=249586 RepID=UPI0033D438EE